MKFHIYILLVSQSTISRHLFRQWLGTEQTLKHYLNQSSKVWNWPVETNYQSLAPTSQFRGQLAERKCGDKTVHSLAHGHIEHDVVIIFRVTSPLCGEFTGHRWIPLKKPSDAELWCFLCFAFDKRLSKQWRLWWFGKPSCSLWCHCKGLIDYSCSIIRQTIWLKGPQFYSASCTMKSSCP